MQVKNVIIGCLMSISASYVSAQLIPSSVTDALEVAQEAADTVKEAVNTVQDVADKVEKTVDTVKEASSGEKDD